MVHTDLSTPSKHFDSRAIDSYGDVICSVVGRQNAKALLDIMTVRRLVRGQRIFDEASQSNALAIVATGSVTLTALMTDGRQQVVGLFFKSDALWQRSSSSSEFVAEAACDAEVCLFQGNALAAALSTQSALIHALVSKSMDDLDSARAHLLVLGRMTALEKIACLLVELEQADKSSLRSLKHSSSNLPTIFLPMTRLTMADYLGLTVETVSRCLTKLKSGGLIRFRGVRTVEFCDPDGLRALAEGSETCMIYKSEWTRGRNRFQDGIGMTRN